MFQNTEVVAMQLYAVCSNNITNYHKPYLQKNEMDALVGGLHKICMSNY